MTLPKRKLLVLFVVHITVIGFAGFLILIIKSHHLTLKREIPSPTNGSFYFNDLTGDGSNEMIFKKSYYERIPTLRIQGKDNLLLNEVKLEGDWAEGQPLFFTDITTDGVKEIFAFTIIDDSLMLSVCSMDRVLSQFFITQLDLDHTSRDYDVSTAGVWGKYFYFCLNAGYSLKPRAVYRINLQTGLLKRTIMEGAIIKNPFFFDLNKDGDPEIVTRSFAPTNIHY
ncbi:MAG: hypothetical protein AAF391_14045, partial [Bacteroidota bacterium]